MKQEVVKILQKALKELKVKLKPEEIEKFIEVPKDHENGDFAFPCFFLSRQLKTDPHDIALDIRTKIGNSHAQFQEVQTAGPYINFFVNRKALALEIMSKIIKQKDSFGKFSKNVKTVLVEFPGPNTNKPLHLGHLRNMAIGESVSRILEFSGFKVVRGNIVNNVGIHICKSMAAYQKFGKNKTPKSEKKKSDHFVGDYYVMFNDKSKKDKKLDLLSHHLLQKSEQGDKETLELLHKMNKWALEGLKQTYEKFGIKHDCEDYESKIYTKGREIILKGVEDGVFKKKKKDGAVYINLKNKKLGEKVLLRADGTSLYMTQDLYLAKQRLEKYSLNEIIYVVAHEQDYHFNVLFEILELLKIANKNSLTHLSYGMVNLPEGKMKSREGTIVDADNLIDKVQDLVKKQLVKRDKLSKKHLEERSLKIALAAIKYLLLKTDIKKDITFDPKQSISFEGDTGPYIQYSYARANSIIKKAKTKAIQIKKFENLKPKEIELVKKLFEFPQLTQKACNDLNPTLIANYAFDLAQIFNEFYHTCPVIGSSEKEVFRLKLVKSFKQVLKNSLYLLGMEALEKM